MKELNSPCAVIEVRDENDVALYTWPVDIIKYTFNFPKATKRMLPLHIQYR